jgi:regulator of protease activity HflC (stomatin/prohibitin superfamily)
MLYQTFRRDVDQVAHGFVRQTVRAALQQVAGGATTADMIGAQKEALRAQAEQILGAKLAPYGIDVKQFTINEIRPPQSMVDAINAKNRVEQDALRTKNQLLQQQYKAQGDSIEAAGRAKAVVAEAEAEARSIELRAAANERMSRSISPALIEYEKAKRWNGALPNFMGSSVQPYMQIKP